MDQSATPPQNISEIKFRTATNLDRDRIESLVFGVLAEYDLPPSPESTDADLQDIEGGYLQRGGVFEIIEDGQGRLLGTVGLYPLDDETCELRKMYLAPQVRGLGLGKRILERMIARARSLGFKKMVLETSSKLEAAKRLYLKFGFQAMRHEHLSPRADQSYFLELS